jgi:branched-subunit amino acid aminotransferase/4-amino-4-deoxychorismate lyase
VTLKACTLTSAERVFQRGRYKRLREAVESVHRVPTELTVHFGAGVDAELLAKTVAVERECCSFLDIQHDGLVLRLGSDDPHDLDPFERALR